MAKIIKSINSHLYPEIIKRWNKGDAFTEIYKSLNLKKSTFNYIRRRLNLSREYLPKTVLIDNYTKEVLIGTILGDATITIGSKVSSALSFSHCSAKKEYFDFKVKILEIFGECYNKQEFKLNKTVDKIYERYTYHSKSYTNLSELRKVFYPNGIKIIPMDYIKENFTEVSLAYMYMDDGNTYKYNTTIATQGFEKENLEEFVIFLKEKFDLKFKVQSNNTLRVLQQDVIRFKDLISKEINKIDCMKYKL